MEEIDVFNEDFTPADFKSATIDVIHQKGLWHQTFACWLINPDENKIFFQLRGPKNKVGPNTLDASASGHLSSGENPEDGFRELYEELGVNIDISDKIFLGIHRNIAIQGAYLNREFCHVYMAKTAMKIDDFDLQLGEVSGVFSLNITEGIQLFSNKKTSVLIEGKIWDGEQYKLEKREVTQQNFCLYRDRIDISGYYLKIMIMAERYIQNKEPYRI